ncbi:MAG TPA: glycosyltransferase family 2 protein [Caulobacteraceae bacterium]|nr:glycosyltransferase family 2 protein [Caulobacteraceae bacterium]
MSTTLAPAVGAPPASGRDDTIPRLDLAGVWVVIPCYKVRSHIGRVIARTPDWITGIVCVDDACPEHSGEFVTREVADRRVVVVTLAENQGVGGATLAGYGEAIARGARVLVKVDGDDQMDLAHLPALVAPILLGQSDYTKGNRFSSQSHIQGMPSVRVLGNIGLSFAAKLSTGYWNIFDPTNGFTAIHADVAEILLSRPIARRYFFETDLLYHLGTLRAVVRDIPMPARYADEISNLKIGSTILPFAGRHLRNWARRMIGDYFVRDFNIATLEVLVGGASLAFGIAHALAWISVRLPGQAASAGMVMGAALPIIIGVQLLLQAINYDVTHTPTQPIHPYLRTVKQMAATDKLRALSAAPDRRD